MQTPGAIDGPHPTTANPGFEKIPVIDRPPDREVYRLILKDLFDSLFV